MVYATTQKFGALYNFLDKTALIFTNMIMLKTSIFIFYIMFYYHIRLLSYNVSGHRLEKIHTATSRNIAYFLSIDHEFYYVSPFDSHLINF